MESATINDMPNVLDNILGSLPLKDTVKTSIMSKDWRYKWVTRAELDFSDEFFTSFSDNQEATTIIYKILQVHQGPILKFTLQGPNVTSCPDHWMLLLSKKNVQEFTLHISFGNDHHSPSHLFTFQQLRHLDVQNCSFQPLPDFKGFAKLVNLNLREFILDPAIFLNVISKWPALEKLRLYWCTGFDILEIDAVNLKYFYFLGATGSICFKNTPMLRSVIVWLNPLVRTNPSPFCSNLTKFFHYMPSLQVLALRGSTFEYLTKGGMPESPPTALNNIIILSIFKMSFRNAEEVSGAVYLITSCPKLEELTIECERVGIVVEPVAQFLLAKSISCGVLKVLQRVEMSCFTGFEMEMEFVKFILAYAPVLEEMYIFWKTGHFHRGTQMMDEIKQFRRASPSVRFKFLESLPDPVLP